MNYSSPHAQHFNQHRVLITGAASGLGFEMCKSFLGLGATVEAWDVSPSGLEKAQQELAVYEKKIHFRKVDVSRPSEVSDSAKSIPDLSVLINNAGITRDKSFSKMAAEDWDAVIQVNLSSLFYVTKALQEKMTSPLKRIINISSVVGLYGNFGQANYAAAKAGVIGFTKTLAKELGRKGFTVNAIAPGFIQTPMTSAMPAEVLQSMAAKVPVQRLGTPEDISQAAVFLASPASSYINGSVLSVDGGLTL
ncbi:MAG: 3-oxoacyl-ACP reductase FabG [Bdellovibrio sp.]